MMVYTVIPPFQQSPKRLDTICMDLTPDILTDFMINGFMIPFIPIHNITVGIHHCITRFNVFVYEMIQSYTVCFRNRRGSHFARIPVPYANNYGFFGFTLLVFMLVL